MCKSHPFKIVATLARLCLVLIALGPTQYSASLAQGAKSAAVIVSAVSARSSANGTIVSIAADGSLSRAQTWQDSDGYHVVVPAGATPREVKVANGIKVMQLDHSLEILLQTRPGAIVTAQPSANHLKLAIEGQLEPRTLTTDSSKKISGSTDSSPAPGNERKANSLRESELDDSKTGLAAPAIAGPGYIAQGPAESTPPGVGTAERLNHPVVPEDEYAGFFSPTTVVLILVLALIGLVFIRWRQSRATDIVWNSDQFGFSDFDDLIDLDADPAVEDGLISANGTTGSNGSNGSNGASGQRKSAVRMPVGTPASLFGAFQVDQEVAKLVMGQPHKMEVLASRAPDDRRAIEASLLKALAASDEEERQRVREALEEYGFVARQNAAVLLAQDPYDRTSAARMLGEMKSPSALPFLLEALYDNESLVRNQAVLSIGELRLPAAIGALLDIARKHTDVPGPLLSRALSACSVEGLDFFDIDIDTAVSEIAKLKPATMVQELPESLDDEKFVQALAKLEALDIAERAEGIKLLAQFAVRRSVAALARVARRDAHPNLRSLAIGSLATINHESVFPAVLIGMADESREVRASAARSLSRLRFDRADAYTRVMEANEAETLRDVAQACVKAGVASQAIDRLASADRRQAYEALSLVSLLAQADVLEPIVAAIENHPNADVRVGAVRLLGTTGHPGVLEELREIATKRMPTQVQIALAETIAELEAAGHHNGKLTGAKAVTVQPESRYPENPSGDEGMGDIEFVGGEADRHSDQSKTVFKSQADEPQLNCLEYASEQPRADTSGLPAPPIA